MAAIDNQWKSEVWTVEVPYVELANNGRKLANHVHRCM